MLQIRAQSSQSVQSARLSFQSSEFGPPPPREVSIAPPPLDSRWETHSLGGGRGLGDPILTKGQTLWYYILCTLDPYFTDYFRDHLRNLLNPTQNKIQCARSVKFICGY